MRSPIEMHYFSIYELGGLKKKYSHAEWGDLDFRKNVLHVQPKPHRNWKVKDKEDRFVPLPPTLDGEVARPEGQG